MERISIDEYFMEMCDLVAKRSTCLRRQVGAVIVKDGNVVSTGYNGAPIGVEHCLDVGCIRNKLNIPSGTQHELCNAAHAEQNAIVQCAYHGKSSKDSTIYINAQPCIICAKMIINAGIKKVIYKGEYPDPNALEMLKKGGVEVVKY